MPVRPASHGTFVTPLEMEQMVARAGLVLNPGQLADLVLTWRQVAALIAAIPRDRPLADDFAFTFRRGHDDRRPTHCKSESREKTRTKNGIGERERTHPALALPRR
ncbi:MAG TPA: hypothetical protein VMA37_12905 [Acetobacteraceae bacterium]|nr:hypothetical protein [Acetobacteraceae bacterium]